MNDLTGAVRDAQAIAKTLQKRGFEVKRLLNKEASRRNILAELRRLSTVVTNDHRVVVYFAGHGVSETVGKYKMGYFMPHEADPNEPDAAGVDMEKLQLRLNGLAAKHVMFGADACYSGIAVTTRGADATWSYF